MIRYIFCIRHQLAGCVYSPRPHLPTNPPTTAQNHLLHQWTTTCRPASGRRLDDINSSAFRPRGPVRTDSDDGRTDGRADNEIRPHFKELLPLRHKCTCADLCPGSWVKLLRLCGLQHYIKDIKYIKHIKVLKNKTSSYTNPTNISFGNFIKETRRNVRTFETCFFFFV